MNIQVLICHLIEQITNIIDDNSQPFHKCLSGSDKYACLILVGNLWHRRLQIALHKQLHALDTSLHRITDITGQKQRNNGRNQYRSHNHRNIDDHCVPCRGQIIDLRRSNRNTPTVRIRHRSIGCKHFIFSLCITSKSIFTLTHFTMDCRQLPQ